jgi:hypothetical protein
MWQLTLREALGIGHWALPACAEPAGVTAAPQCPIPPIALCPMPNASNKKSRIKMRDDQTLTVLPSPAGEPEDGNS